MEEVCLKIYNMWVRKELEAGLLTLSDRWEIGREEIQEASPNFFNFCFSVRCGRF